MPRAMVPTDYGTAGRRQASIAQVHALPGRRGVRFLPVKDTGFIPELAKIQYLYLSMFLGMACTVVPS